MLRPLATAACLRAGAPGGLFTLGGLGDSIAQLLAREEPLPPEMVAVNDSFGEGATPASSWRNTTCWKAISWLPWKPQ